MRDGKGIYKNPQMSVHQATETQLLPDIFSENAQRCECLQFAIQMKYSLADHCAGELTGVGPHV